MQVDVLVHHHKPPQLSTTLADFNKAHHEVNADPHLKREARVALSTLHAAVVSMRSLLGWELCGTPSVPSPLLLNIIPSQASGIYDKPRESTNTILRKVDSSSRVVGPAKDAFMSRLAPAAVTKDLRGGARQPQPLPGYTWIGLEGVFKLRTSSDHHGHRRERNPRKVTRGHETAMHSLL